MQLQVKLQKKKAEITSLEGTKQQAKYQQTCLDDSK